MSKAFPLAVAVALVGLLPEGTTASPPPLTLTGSFYYQWNSLTRPVAATKEGSSLEATMGCEDSQFLL